MANQRNKPQIPKSNQILTKKGEIILVSIEDYATVSQYKWYIGNKGYAQTSSPGATYRFLHHMIIGRVSERQVDHINRNKLDNRRENLRHVTARENMLNRNIQKNNISGYVGVSYRRDKKKWRARVYLDSKDIFVGYYDTLSEAVKARELAS